MRLPAFHNDAGASSYLVHYLLDEANTAAASEADVDEPSDTVASPAIGSREGEEP